MGEKILEATCIVIGAGDFTLTNIGIQEGDMCIAAGGSYLYCRMLGMEPDLAIGDMDSLDGRMRLRIWYKKPHTVTKPVWGSFYAHGRPEKDLLTQIRFYGDFCFPVVTGESGIHEGAFQPGGKQAHHRYDDQPCQHGEGACVDGGLQHDRELAAE